MANVLPIPEGFTSVTPYLIVEDATAAIALYEKALNAKLISKFAMQDGRIMNAQMQVGDAMIMLMDEMPEFGAIGPKKIGDTAVSLHLYVEDVDARYQQAIDAGFTVSMPLDDQPWGDRYGSLKDPFGHVWSMATHKEEVSEEELARRMGGM